MVCSEQIPRGSITPQITANRAVIEPTRCAECSVRGVIASHYKDAPRISGHFRRGRGRGRPNWEGRLK
jgi:hypothetical protein